MGYSPWSHKELDTTERLHTHTHHVISLVLEAQDISVNKTDTNSDLMEFTF